MNVLVTGATGYIGSVVAEKLAAAGHNVIGLARSDDAAQRLAARGYAVARGDMSDADLVASLARKADATIHTANSQDGAQPELDARLARAVARAYEGTGKRFVYTSGVWSFRDTGERAADESTPTEALDLVRWRVPVEEDVRTAGAVVVRPAIVYGRGARLQGIPGMLVAEAKKSGRVRVVGAGTQKWPLVHVDDLADLYVRALDAPAGSILHGVGDACATMQDVALAASFAGGAPGRVEAWPLADARKALGAFADALAVSQRISSARTRALTGWQPKGRTIFEELLTGSYASA